ncbi:MAG: DUF11 domain-containing protein [Candidatus Goldbacteria bacterium]|nr:DUF11 domain-containing protein [Candidatus Goldiibacteriota bacterium]
MDKTAFKTAVLGAVLFFMKAVSHLYGAVYTICPSGCDYVSIQAAYNGASTGDTLELRANLSENMTWTTAGKSCDITSQNGQRFTWDGADNSGATFVLNNITTSLPAWTISDIVMNHSSSSGGNVIELKGGGQVHPNVTIDNCVLMRTSTSTVNNNIIVNTSSWDTNTNDQVSLNRTEIIGSSYCNGLSFLQANGGGNTQYTYNLTNCIIRNFTGAMSAFYDDVPNQGLRIQALNCTFFNNYNVLRSSGDYRNTVGFIKNCFFLANTNDVSNLHAGMKPYFTYCAISGSGYGTGCQYNPALTEVIDASVTAPDLRLSSSSVKCLDLGTNSGAPAVDFDNNARPFNGVTDIGAFERRLNIPMIKSANPIKGTFGDTITFCIEYTNANSEAVSFNIWDTVPYAMDYVSCDSGCGVNYYGDIKVVYWVYTQLASGATGTVCFSAVIARYP